MESTQLQHDEGTGPPLHYAVLGVRIDALQLPDAITLMDRWIQQKSSPRYIVAANSHVVMECRSNAKTREAVAAADLVLPDGAPLVWIARRRGIPLRGRAYGPTLLQAFLEHSVVRGYRHYFYGGTREMLDALLLRAEERWPGLRIVGTHAPPFRPLTEEEDRRAIEAINRARPDVLWVGLGCPKQERWMYEHRGRLEVPVIAAVGQGLGIAAGIKREVPTWLGDHGLEWLFRLVLEPRRTWRRVVLLAPAFAFLVLREEFKLRKQLGKTP